MSISLIKVKELLERKNYLGKQIEILNEEFSDLEGKIHHQKMLVKKEKADVTNLEKRITHNFILEVSKKYNEEYEKEISEYEESAEIYNKLLSDSDSLKEKLEFYLDVYNTIPYNNDDFEKIRKQKVYEIIDNPKYSTSLCDLTEKYNKLTRDVNEINKLITLNNKIINQMNRLINTLYIVTNNISRPPVSTDSLTKLTTQSKKECKNLINSLRKYKIRLINILDEKNDINYTKNLISKTIKVIINFYKLDDYDSYYNNKKEFQTLFSKYNHLGKILIKNQSVMLKDKSFIDNSINDVLIMCEKQEITERNKKLCKNAKLKNVKDALERKKILSTDIDKLYRELKKSINDSKEIMKVLKKEEADLYNIDSDDYFNDKYFKELSEYNEAEKNYNQTIDKINKTKEELSIKTNQYDLINYTEKDFLIIRASRMKSLLKNPLYERRMNYYINYLETVLYEIELIDKTYNIGSNLVELFRDLRNYTFNDQERLILEQNEYNIKYMVKINKYYKYFNRYIINSYYLEIDEIEKIDIQEFFNEINLIFTKIQVSGINNMTLLMLNIEDYINIIIKFQKSLYQKKVLNKDMKEQIYEDIYNLIVESEFE